MKKDLCEGQDQVENEPDVHHLDVGRLWQLVGDVDEHCSQNLKIKYKGGILLLVYSNIKN